MMEKIFSFRNVQILIGLKIFFAIIFILVDSKVIYFGEKTISASEHMAAADSTEQPESSVANQEDDPSKGYLERLLDLPDVSGDHLKKKEVARYLDMIQRKKSEVEQRIASLGEREASLKKLERSIEQKIAHLEQERKFFAESVQKEKEIKSERLNELISFYQKMGPKKAAPVIEKMDRDLAVQLFKSMPPKQTTSILEAMDPEKSVVLSEYYARIRSGREYDILKEMNQSLVGEFRDYCQDGKKGDGKPSLAH